jgi:PLP dependent protein
MDQHNDSTSDDGTIQAALQAVHMRMRAAAERAGRNPEDVALVAVSKTKPFEFIEEALAAGHLDFGENRLEELWEKVEIARQRGLDQIRWHMIGTIQSRKTSQAVGPFTLVHAVDRVKIARRLHQEAEEQGVVLPVLLEVNVSGEESKHGFSPQMLLEVMPELLTFDALRYEGLMTMAPIVNDPEETRPIFRGLRELLEQLRRLYPPQEHPQVTWQHLSMGMTDDFEVAIEEGATLIRIGTAIFGKRDQKDATRG